MKISLKDLRASPAQNKRFTYLESVNLPELTEPVKVEIDLIANSTSVRLTGNIQATAKLSCHRCLGTFLQLINLNLDEEFVYEDYLNAQTMKGKERELLKDDFFETIPYDGSIDVSDVIYQSVVLAIPNYCACGQACAGPAIYKETNSAKNQKEGTGDTKSPPLIDPRWHNLKTIFSNDTQN